MNLTGVCPRRAWGIALAALQAAAIHTVEAKHLITKDT